MPTAAQHAHENHRQRHRDVESLTDRHIGNIQRMDGPHDTRKKTRQSESPHLEPEGGHPVDLGHIFVVVDRKQTQTRAGMKQPPSDGDTQNRQDEAGVIER